jgi:hypothetical protein
MKYFFLIKIIFIFRFVINAFITKTGKPLKGTTVNMPSSRILRRPALVRIDVSEEGIASIIRVAKVGEVGTTLPIISNCVLRLLHTAKALSSSILVTLMMKAVRYYETSIITKATRRNIKGEGFLHSDRRRTIKAYTEY